MSSTRIIERPFTVSFEERAVASAVAIATASTVAVAVADRPLPGATFREPVASNLQIISLTPFTLMGPLLKFFIRR